MAAKVLGRLKGPFIFTWPYFIFLSGLFQSYLRECDMNSWRFNSSHDFSGFHHARMLHRSAAKQPRPDGGSFSSDDRDVVVTRDANVGVAAFVARSARHDSTVSWFDERASNRGLYLSTSQRQPQCRKDILCSRMLDFVSRDWDSFELCQAVDVLAFELIPFGSRCAAPFFPLKYSLENLLRAVFWL